MAAAHFSLEKFEHYAYARKRDEATRELLALLQHLYQNAGRLGPIGDASSGIPETEWRDAHFATRIASAIAVLFLDPGFELKEEEFYAFMGHHSWLANVFGASPFGNADHIIGLISRSGPTNRAEISLTDSDFLKFCLLYSLDSRIPLQAGALWNKNKKVAACLFAALLSPTIVLSEEAHSKREELLKWFLPRIKELSFEDRAVRMLDSVWMHCSYAEGPDKHLIKREINGLLKKQLPAAGLLDVSPHPTLHSPKPVLLCVLEWFHSKHPIYRTHSKSLEALKSKYRLVGVSLREESDEVSRSLFDEVHLVPRSLSTGDAVRAVLKIANHLRPDIAYFPSMGMFSTTIMLINLRLAPIQMAALGHPATSHSPCVDYVLVEEDYLGDPSCFSEKVVALPKDSMPYRPPENCPHIAPRRRTAPETVRIAIAASLMKLNAPFLGVLKKIQEQCKARIEFHFFTGLAFGLAKVYSQNLIKLKLPGSAVAHPHLQYERYLQGLNECDMFLNPFPFGNTNGIVDTVRQGLPGICLSGPEVHSHIDEGLFHRLRLPDWLIARSQEEYVKAAVRLIDHEDVRARISNALLRLNPDEILFKGDTRKFVDTVAWLHENHHALITSQEKVLRYPGTAGAPGSKRQEPKRPPSRKA